jgi:hypothetical protein
VCVCVYVCVFLHLQHLRCGKAVPSPLALRALKTTALLVSGPSFMPPAGLCAATWVNTDKLNICQVLKAAACCFAIITRATPAASGGDVHSAGLMGGGQHWPSTMQQKEEPQGLSMASENVSCKMVARLCSEGAAWCPHVPWLHVPSVIQAQCRHGRSAHTGQSLARILVVPKVTVLPLLCVRWCGFSAGAEGQRGGGANWLC